MPKPSEILPKGTAKIVASFPGSGVGGGKRDPDTHC